MCTNLLNASISLPESEGKIFVPSLDMVMAPPTFANVYKTLVSKGYHFIAFLFRAPDKISKINYDYLFVTEDTIKKHISGLQWRRRKSKRNKAWPLAMWTIGFTSCAFGGRPVFFEEDKDDESQERTWNIEKDYIKFYNPLTKNIDTLSFFEPNQNCNCSIHQGGNVITKAQEFYDTEVDAIFSSLHDMHTIQDELISLGPVSEKKIKTDLVLRKYYESTVGKRRSKL
jgi:hypothetical protein